MCAHVKRLFSFRHWRITADIIDVNHFLYRKCDVTVMVVVGRLADDCRLASGVNGERGRRRFASLSDLVASGRRQQRRRAKRRRGRRGRDPVAAAVGGGRRRRESERGGVVSEWRHGGGGDRRRRADEDARERKGARRRAAGQRHRQSAARSVADDRRRTVPDAAAARRRNIVDAGGTLTSVIGTAPVFGACAMFCRLGVAQVLLLLPLGSTVLKPYLHLHRIQQSLWSYHLARTIHILSSTKLHIKSQQN